MKFPRNLWGIMSSSGRYGQFLPVSASPVWSDLFSLWGGRGQSYFPFFFICVGSGCSGTLLVYPCLISFGLEGSRSGNTIPWLVLLEYFSLKTFGVLVCLDTLIPHPSGIIFSWFVNHGYVCPRRCDLLWVGVLDQFVSLELIENINW